MAEHMHQTGAACSWKGPPFLSSPFCCFTATRGQHLQSTFSLGVLNARSLSSAWLRPGRSDLQQVQSDVGRTDYSHVLQPILRRCTECSSTDPSTKYFTTRRGAVEVGWRTFAHTDNSPSLPRTGTQSTPYSVVPLFPSFLSVPLQYQQTT